MNDRRLRFHAAVAALFISLGFLAIDPARCQELSSDEDAAAEVHMTEESSDLAPSLRWNLPIDVPFELTMQQTTRTITTAPPRTLRTRVDISATIEWRVEEVSEQGEMRIRQTMRELRLLVAPPGALEPVLFDSTLSDPLRGPARSLADAVSPLLETTMALTLDSRGKVRQVEIPEATREALELLAARGESTPWFSPESLQNMVERSLLPLPEGPVELGSTWQAEEDVDGPEGPLRKTSHYTYHGIGGENDGEPGTSESSGSRHHRIEMRARFAAAPHVPPDPDTPHPHDDSLPRHELTGLFHWDPGLAGIGRGEIHQRLLTTSQFQDKPVVVRLTSELTWRLRRMGP